MAKTITIDARGDQCPIPVVKTNQALQQMTGDGIVQTHVDNEIAVQNLTKMAKQKGLTVRSEKLEDNHYLVNILTTEGLSTENEAPAACIPDARRNLVIAVDSACMGRGNDELGQVLMKGFLYAVSQLEKLPETMLFYNGGATLTTEGSDSLEDLKSLEAQGVTIKTCGTCLNYYNLSDKLAVGEVTNMYDIVETLANAAQVIKP